VICVACAEENDGWEVKPLVKKSSLDDSDPPAAAQ
jgi:hypothetical protein